MRRILSLIFAFGGLGLSAQEPTDSWRQLRLKLQFLITLTNYRLFADNVSYMS